MRQSARKAEHDAGPQSRLAELLECERDLADLMTLSREEARRRLDEARSEVERAEAELEASLEEEAERVRREVREASQARVHEILARAREQGGRFESLGDEEVERLAAAAFRRLLGAEERSA